MSSKSRSYVSIACDNCRKRRRKCNGELPCHYCSGKNKPCVYDKTKDKRRRRVDLVYVDYLEHKYNNLLNFVKRIRSTTKDERLRAQCNEMLANNDPKFIDNKDLGLSNDESTHNNQSDKQQKEIIQLDNPMDELVSMKWELKFDESGNTKFLGPPVRQVDRCLVKDSMVAMEDPERVSYFNETVLADTEFMKELINTFFQNLLPFNLVLEEINVDEITREITSMTGKRSCYEAVSCLHLLALAILAYGFSILPKDHPYFQNLNGWNPLLSIVERSLFKLLRKSSHTTTGNLTDHSHIVYTILIITILHLGNYDESQAWVYSSILCSQIQHVGWNVSTDYPSESNDLSKFRSKLFWNCLVVEKISASMFGRSSPINFRQLLTDFYTSETKDINELVFQFNSKLWFIYDKFMGQVYSFHFNTQNKMLYKKVLMTATQSFQDFQGFMNQYLPLNETNLDNQNIILLHLTFHVFLLLIIRPYMKMPEIAGSIFQKSISITEQCYILINQYNSKFGNGVTTGWYNCHYGFLLYQVSVFLLCAIPVHDSVGPPGQHNVLIQRLHLFLQCLKNGSKYLPVYNVYYQTLLNIFNNMTLDEEISILVRQAYENESIEVKTSSVEKEDLVLDFDQDWQSYVNSLNLELNQDVYSYLEEGILDML
ncbi:hypothetical protein MG9_04833 [Candida albicans P37037]|nr:hypothetical protein MG9_04833 [Candida albicans P37037]